MLRLPHNEPNAAIRYGIPVPDQEPPSPDSADAADLIVRAARELRRRWMSSLEPWGLSPHEFRALRAVLDGGPSGGAARLSEIAESLRVAPRSATDVVDALESKGLVRRSPDPADRRAVRVEPTDHGRRLADEIRSQRAVVGAAMLAPLDADEQATLHGLLTRALAQPSAGPTRSEDPPTSR